MRPRNPVRYRINRGIRLRERSLPSLYLGPPGAKLKVNFPDSPLLHSSSPARAAISMAPPLFANNSIEGNINHLILEVLVLTSSHRGEMAEGMGV